MFQRNQECTDGFVVSDLLASGLSLDSPLIVSIPGGFVGRASFLSTQTICRVFESYRSTANLLLDSDMLKDIDHTISLIYKTFEVLPFVFVEGSSGCGKTQFAMTLYERSKQSSNTRNVYYLVCSKYGDSTQIIYRYFISMSELFMKCIYQDFSSRSRPKESRDGLLEDNLFVFGFIYQLLFEDIYGTQDYVKISRMNGSALRSLIDERLPLDCRPVVILDEFLPDDNGGDEVYLNFMRNCFLAVGIVVILTGTDAKVASLIGRSENTRCVDVIPWCYIFTHLPKVINLFPDVQQGGLWHQILCNSRPYFAKKAYNLMLEDGNDLDAILEKLFAVFFNAKGIYFADNIPGHTGQIVLTMNAFHVSVSQSQSTYLIHKHYGRLMLDNEPSILLCDGKLAGHPQNIWHPISKFPSSSEDLLLHLVMLGGKNYHSTYCDGVIRPLRAALQSLILDSDARKWLYISDFTNIQQGISNWQWFEALIAAAVCLSSRQNGVKGFGLKDFFNFLLQHLHPSATTMDHLQVQNMELLDDFSFIIVPFFTTPGTQWPDFIKNSQHLLCRDFDRTKNIDHISARGELRRVLTDGREETRYLVMKSKCSKSIVSVEEIQEVLLRIRDDIEVTLLVGTSFDSNYFKSKSFALFVSQNAAMCDCKFLKVSLASDTPSFMDLLERFKLTPQAGYPRRLVVFIEIRQLA
ncbi:hypothetical protein MP228_006002 [Amoeboaphelidium protococcarum]|nr:hypothetical protein MP228_006002 [Amoeboaphelidium protococcarum]